MAKKRGGLAGFWDNQKGWLKYVAPAVVGAIPGLGPLAAAGVGAAMRGLDREGKSGIGFDVKQGIRGGLEGYGMGKLGKGARTGIAKMFAPKGLDMPETLGFTNTMTTPSVGAPSAGSMGAIGNAAVAPDPLSLSAPSSFVEAPARSISASAPASTSPAVSTGASATQTAANAAKSVGEKKPRRITQGLDYLAKYEKPLALLTKGVMSGIPSEEDALNAESTRQTMRLNQQRFDEEMRRQRMQEERMANMTQLLIPLLRQQMAQPQPRTLAEYLQGR